MLTACLKRNRRKEATAETALMQNVEKNGAMLLKEVIASSYGKCCPIRCFSVEELKNAINIHDIDDDFNTLYKASLQGRPICIKKYSPATNISSVIKEIVIASWMSNHKNVLKLLGCCLETEIPILVFDFAEIMGTLGRSLYGSCEPEWQPLPWKCRLRVAVDVANAVAYLHTALPTPIIHRDIKPENIFLDQSNFAKLSDFSFCISIPEGKTQVKVDVVPGTFGFMAPEHITTCCLTEKADVYSFGMLLLVLLTGQRYFWHKFECGIDDLDEVSNPAKAFVENNRLSEIVDPVVLKEAAGRPGMEQQLQDFATVALRCINLTVEDRPTMIDAAKQLLQIEQSTLAQ
ncbi:serine/threonine-protein kinase ZRK1-like [Malania oleifera]|uniref:serine/threonine-protein kinase ZRK1-like n=1 Tax=Malania oleifera TaxID=397392 RepID=UPI0025ADCA36|nr:serine/threonine-protein kinase ZRK1-like [Malania oleifera]